MSAKLSKFKPLFMKSLSPSIVLGVVLIALAVYFGSQYLKQSYQERLQETATVTAKGVNSLINERLNNYHLVIRSIANHHQDRIYELATGGGYPYDFTQISSDIFTLFSEAKEFAVINRHGRAVVVSQGDALDAQCQGQVEKMMTQTQGDIKAELHHSGQGYHFDVVVRISRGDEMAALFVSFTLEHLQKLLSQFASPELKLVLVEVQNPEKIVISSSVGSDQTVQKAMPVNFHQHALAKESVENTRWMLLALPVDGVFANYARQIHLFAWLLFFGLLLLLLVFSYYLKKANQARFQAEKKASYSALFNAGPTVLFEKNYPAGMSIEYVSPNVFQLLGFRDSELIAERSFYDLVHPKDLPGFKQAILRAIDNEVPSFEIEYRLMAADWDYIWVYSLVHLTRTKTNQVARIQGYITSIQAQKLAEQQATTLIENAPDAMVVTDTQGRIQSLNKMAEQLFETDREGVKALSMVEWIPSYQKALEGLLISGVTTQNECKGQTSSGKQLTLAVSLNHLQTADGVVVASVIRDVSLQKAAQQQMLLAKERAESLAQARSQFVAMISHEIRTPMNGVLGMADLLSETPLDESQQKYLGAIRESGRSLVAILNDVLDFSKLEQGGIHLFNEPFNLQDLVNNCIRLLMPQAKIGGVSIQQSYAQDCPLWVQGDALRLRQVLLNLVGNAIKFSPNGQVHINVALLKSDESKTHLQFSVQDNGIGIAKSQQARLFEPFTQADSSTSRHYGGTGLGLAITKQLVDLMEGDIQLVSELGQGSTFILKLSFGLVTNIPQQEWSLQEEMAQQDKALPAETVDDTARPGQEKPLKRVLLVEDDVTNQQIAEAFIHKLGLDVDVVNNGLEALEFWRLHHGQFGLVLMDCQMPIMDGYEASRLIRQEEALLEPLNPAVIIAFTANAYKEDERRCLEAGMNDFLVKPLFMEDFQKMVYKWFPDLSRK